MPSRFSSPGRRCSERLAWYPRDAVRLFLIWMTYCGFFQSLPQAVAGALSPRSDVGMAMDYLQLGAAAKTVAALVALVAMPPIALWLARRLLGLADASINTASAGARSRFAFRVATLPVLIALPLIIAFRVPREFIEVVMLPVVVAWIGIAWIQAGAWWVSAAEASGGWTRASVAYPLGAVLVLLFVFQVLLRPGVPFY